MSFFPEVISLFPKSALRKGLFLIALGVATHLALVSASFASRIEARGDFYCQFDKGNTDAMGAEKFIKFAVPRTMTVKLSGDGENNTVAFGVAGTRFFDKNQNKFKEFSVSGKSLKIKISTDMRSNTTWYHSVDINRETGAAKLHSSNNKGSYIVSARGVCKQTGNAVVENNDANLTALAVSQYEDEQCGIYGLCGVREPTQWDSLKNSFLCGYINKHVTTNRTDAIRKSQAEERGLDANVCSRIDKLSNASLSKILIEHQERMWGKVSSYSKRLNPDLSSGAKVKSEVAGGLSLEVLRRIREQDPRERNPWKAMAEVQGAGSSTSIGDVGPDVTRERDVSVGGARFREITRPGFSHREAIGSGAPRFSMKELGTFEDGDCFFPPCNQERGLTDPNKSIDLLIKKRLAESSEQSTNAEIGFWQSVSSSQDPEVLRSYLVRYPDGQFSALAKAKIEGIERFTVEQKIAEARALEERTTSAEIVSWQSVSSSQDPEVVRRYLLQYPDGRFVALAEAKISSLERVAAEQKIVEARLKEERARDVEDGAWREAAISNDLGVVNSYLKSYPEGRYVDLARQQLKFLERSQFGVAVVIGNKNYSSKLIPEVNYAHNDADLFLEVINKNMGYSSENIIDLRDASQAQMLSTFGNEKNHKGKLWSFLDSKGRSDVVIFYSGHGAPGLQDKRGYILPSDSDPNTVEINGYPLELLLKNLSKLEDAKSVTVFLESCFSGVGHSGPLVSAASPVFVKVKEPSPARNVVVVSAASNEQVASWDDRNKVGLFSRYLAEGLTGRADINQDMRVTGQEILDYLDENMTPAARRLFMRQQNAQLIGDPNSILSVLR